MKHHLFHFSAQVYAVAESVFDESEEFDEQLLTLLSSASLFLH